MVTWLRSNDTGHWVLKRPAWAGSYREMAAFVSGESRDDR
jgi:hypothetical protein